MRNAESIWPPVLDNLKSKLVDGEKLNLVISPFIKKDALSVLLDTFPPLSARVIVRWRMEDLLAGVSDLEIYKVLSDLGIPLYLHPTIHLKLFHFSSGNAYSGSSNITGKGLSLSESYNEEMGVVFALDLDSYSNIRRLCDDSRIVTPEIVEAYEEALRNSKVSSPAVGQLSLPLEEKKQFLVSELPATDSPESFLSAASKYFESGEGCPKFLHDVGTLGITEADLTKQDLKDLVIEKFKEKPFTKVIVKEIRSVYDMNFGAVTALVHSIAEDVPLPYRSEIKDAISRLYPWLVESHNDISTHIPGAISEVIMSSLSEAEPNYSKSSRRRRKG